MSTYPPKSVAGIQPAKKFKNVIKTLANVTSTGGTLTLTNGSDQQQYITGAMTHTVVLPVVSTLILGQQYEIKNGSTENVTIQSSGLNTISTIIPESSLVVTCVSLTGTGTSSWTYQSLFTSSPGAPGLAVSGSYEARASDALSITAGNAYIFPTMIINTNNQYNTTTGIYTIPVTGWYAFSLVSETTNALGVRFQLIGRVDSPLNQDVVLADTGGRGIRATLSHAMYCDANQPFFWKCITNPVVGGRQTLRIYSLF